MSITDASEPRYVNVTARVVGVRPRKDGSFSVTLGPGPRIFWFLTELPPKLGQLVRVEGAVAIPTRLRKTSAVITQLEGGRMTVTEDQFARRVVSPEWMKRVQMVMRRPLYAYQAEGAAWLAERIALGRGAILADEMGLGKSTQVIAALVASRCIPAVIVCPSSLKINWAREFAHARVPLKVVVLKGGNGPIPQAHVIVCNYDVLRSREKQFTGLGARVLVMDEAHALKHPNAHSEHRAAIATRIAHRIGRTILLTGSPLLNRTQELWRLLHIVAPREWPSYQDYKLRFCTSPDEDEKKTRTIVTSHGQAKRIDELQSLVAPVMLRRLRAEALRGLPPKTRRTALIQLDPIDQKNYDDAERDVVSWLKRTGTGGSSINPTMRNQALIKLTMLRRIAAVGKLRRAAHDYIAAWFTKEKRPLIVFAYHRRVLLGLRIICERLGLRISGISGKDSDEERQRQVDLFQQGGADVFIAPIRSAGVGLNLQRASDVLFLERVWTPSLINQAEDRAHRLGQVNPVTVTFLDAAKTVDEYIAEVLASKQVLIDRVVDDRSSSGGSHLRRETIDEVIRKMIAAGPVHAVPAAPKASSGQDRVAPNRS